MNSKIISLDNIEAFIFDFDGVMTNNSVYLDEFGNEVVKCSRADGLAFDVLRKLKKPAYIVSTEKNAVVQARAKKLKVQVIQGVDDKVLAVKELCDKKSYNLQNIFYVGNDVNDCLIMKLCGHSACPADSHIEVKKIAREVLTTKGGNGVVRELLESVLGLDFIQILYIN